MIQTFDITENEKKIVEMLRNLKPYESVTIMADAQGRLDSYLLTRSSKVLLIVNKEPEYVKARFNLKD